MKLTNRTTPQAINYRCDKCGRLLPHKEMEDDKICIDCYMEESESDGGENGR